MYKTNGVGSNVGLNSDIEINNSEAADGDFSKPRLEKSNDTFSALPKLDLKKPLTLKKPSVEAFQYIKETFKERIKQYDPNSLKNGGRGDDKFGLTRTNSGRELLYRSAPPDEMYEALETNKLIKGGGGEVSTTPSRSYASEYCQPKSGVLLEIALKKGSFDKLIEKAAAHTSETTKKFVEDEKLNLPLEKQRRAEMHKRRTVLHNNKINTKDEAKKQEYQGEMDKLGWVTVKLEGDRCKSPMNSDIKQVTIQVGPGLEMFNEYIDKISLVDSNKDRKIKKAKHDDNGDPV
ncbi:hypothetical protein AWB78_08369 [Caballeronia calidae]|uniref:Uncharacterized protein n=1 Tax=Caballeronia calidae TaxID=1777139 RepID=A0A158EJE7_9BURK|nr:hypothetical protein [Caballeronia calidae]SAL07012.1 hypothetical protein AWB78_08369 [Caballeronia calidae]